MYKKKDMIMKTMKYYLRDMMEAWTELKADREAMDLAIGIVFLPVWAFTFWAWMWIISWMA